MRFLFLAVFLGVSATTVFAEKPIFVICLYRHGDRSPAFLYPTDPNPGSIWENGLGQLTNLGKNQMYLLGKYIRNRYCGLLPEKYYERDIEVISSDVSRALMSAYVTLAGLYEPRDQDVWSYSIDWQPIPVHCIPIPQDNLLYNARNCTKHSMLLQNHLEENREKLEDYYDILEEVFQFAGIPLRRQDNINYKILLLGLGIYDCLFVEQSNNLTLPEWTQNYYPEPLREIALFTYSLTSATKELRRLRCGPLLKEMLKLFDEVKKGTLGKKMYQYSAHDLTIIDLLQCLDAYDGEITPYASAVFLELYDTNNVLEVLISYKKEDVVKELIIPGCNGMVRCPLDLLKELVSDVIPDDWEKECVSV